LGLFWEMKHLVGGYVRLEAENVADAVRLVAGLVALDVDLAERVDELDAGLPLIDGELDLAGEVVEVADQSAEDLAMARAGLGAHAVDHLVGEVGVEAVRRLVRGHCDGCVWCKW
jgi:hypothetical protein